MKLDDTERRHCEAQDKANHVDFREKEKTKLAERHKHKHQVNHGCILTL